MFDALTLNEKKRTQTFYCMDHTKLWAFMLVLLSIQLTGKLEAQKGEWVDYSLDGFGTGRYLYGCGNSSCGHTRANSQFVLIYDTERNDWLKADLETAPSFQHLESKGAVIWAWSEELLFGYSEKTSDWDTIRCEGTLLRDHYQQLFRSYGCSDSLAFFITDQYFYVFNANTGNWQSYDYDCPADFTSGQFYPKNDCIYFLLKTSDYNGDVKNVAYSSHTRSFNTINNGTNHIQQNYDHGFAGRRDKSGVGDEYLLIGYSAFDNEFDVISYNTADNEKAHIFFESSMLDADTIISYCIGFRAYSSPTKVQAKFFGYSTMLGEWNTVTYDIDHSVENYYGNGNMGGQYAADVNTNADSDWYFYFYSAVDGLFSKLNTDLVYTSTTSQFRVGGSVFSVYDANHAWGYNPVTEKGNKVDLVNEKSAHFYAADDYATLCRWSDDSDEMQMYFYNSHTNRWTSTVTKKNLYINPWIAPHEYLFEQEDENHVVIYSSCRDSIMKVGFEENVDLGYEINGKLTCIFSDATSLLVNTEQCKVYEKYFKFNPDGMGTESAVFYDAPGKTLHGYSALSNQWTTKTIEEEPSYACDNEYIGLASAWLNGDLHGKLYAYNSLADNWTELIPEGTRVAELTGSKVAMVVRQTHVYAFDPDLTSDPDSVNDVLVQPGVFLGQNHPNPFSQNTVIDYCLTKSSQVQLKIYNNTGQEVCTLVNDFQPAGKWSIHWDRTDDRNHPVLPGIYYYLLKTDSVTKCRKLIIGD